MKKAILPLALSLMLLFSACGVPAQTPDSSTAPSEAAVPTETAAPAASFASFTAIDLDGNEVDETIFADYELTMINIWATFCGPCLNEMPDIGKLAAEYADKGVRIVGIVADVPQKADGSFDSDMVETARELVLETGADYLHLLPGADLVAAKLNSVNAVPETVFVDSAGNLVGDSYVGARSAEAWSAILDELLTQVQAD